MLSAIAARKAAAAATNLASTSTSSAPILSSSEASSSPTPSKPAVKRKRSQAGLSDVKTPLPSTSASTKSPRYFESQVPNVDEFRGQEDVIVLEDDADSEEADVVQSPLIKEKSERSYSPSRPISLDDSSEEEQEKQENAAISGNSIPEHSLLTTGSLFRHAFAFHISSRTLIALKPSETLTLLGTYRLTVIHGFVEVGGAILHQGSHNVFAPRSSPLPCIQALSPSPVSSPLPHRVETAITKGDIVIILQELRTGVEGLGKVCRTFEGVFGAHPRDIVNRLDDASADALRLKGVQIITQNSKYISGLTIPSSWGRALDKIYPALADLADRNADIEMEDENGEEMPTPLPDIYLVKGPKKIGKSSFARALVNRLLTRYHRVAYLECDLGQSEFTPGGMVALNVIHNPLLGPPFTHPTLPARAHLLGAFSPKTSPGHYIEAVRDLVEFWGREISVGPDSDLAGSDSIEKTVTPPRFSTVPLVVNTMGWAKGLGADLSRKVEETLLDCLSSSLASLAFGFGSKIERSEMHVYDFEYEYELANGHGSIPRSQQQFDDPQIHGPHRAHLYSFHGHGAVSTPSFSSSQKIHLHRMEPAPIHGTSGTTTLTTATALSNFSAADHRALNILSYFHAIFPSPVSASSDSFRAYNFRAPIHTTQWDTSLPLLARPPYQVDVAAAVDKVILLPGAGAEEVVESEIERVLGGAVVGLVSFEPGTLNLDQESSSSKKLKTKTKIPYSPSLSSSSLPSYPSPTNSSAFGIALIRSVAPGGSHLHVLTPLPPALCTSTRMIVKGEMELPVWGFN
ncbi:hypothetical protein BT96DRAFT_982985 [Gymnopus androsaceus JB14]|uniref:Polynucleotide 5'-hydroxyl-kinase GRC3 n=1 Tax=Gymnopus androsaceus JB14 TaxID=1447944 RepID=A0A6A4IFV6_9AGAR|nr:hypothetical protein BT96DRAFT_982985 [Gymnopus androsaceus JB14]